MLHELKIKSRFYWDIYSRRKSFEIRNNDRNFRVGDVLRLKVIDPEPDMIPPRLDCYVTYVLYHKDFPDGIAPGYCVMGIRVMGRVKE